MTMSSLLRVLILVGVICTIHGLLEYRCDVLGCGDGETCDPTSHECTCAGTDDGVPCTSPTPCTIGDPCVAANTITGVHKCHNTFVSDCICIEGYYGDKCQYERVRATCVAGDPLKIYVAPYQKAGNTIKVHYAADAASLNGNNTNYNCGQDTPTQLGTYGEYQRLDLPQNVDSAVGDCQPANLVDGKQVYYVYLQQVSPYRTAADQVFKVICDPSTGASVSTVSDFNVLYPVFGASSSLADGIVMKVRKEETENNLVDIPLGAYVTLGTQLAITFEHPDPMVVVTCTVSDGIYGGEDEELISNLCVPQEAEPLFWGSVQASDPSTVVANGGTAGNNMLKFRVKLFQFFNTGSLLFTLTICKDQTCAGASTPTCDPDNGLTNEMIDVHGDLPLISRRRRAVTGSETQTSLTVTFTVVDGQVVITNGNDGL